MKHSIQLGLAAMIAILVWSCAERTICPAYQSAFIHDKETLTKHFSYFKEDSTPKVLTASKNKYLIAEKKPYWKKVRSLNTVKMQTIYPVLDDSLELTGDVTLQAEMDVVDTVALDSATINEIGWEEHFNVEQEFYFYYFNDVLVYPEERALLEAADAQKDKIDKDQAERTGEKQNIFQKFLGIFRKKPKSDEDELGDTVQQNESTEEESTDAPPKKKKKFSFGKKKKKKDKSDESTTTNTEESIPEEEKEEDDSF